VNVTQKAKALAEKTGLDPEKVERYNKPGFTFDD
jgi:hypothetical protein